MRWKSVRGHSQRFRDTDLMTITVKRPPEGFKIYKVVAVDEIESHKSWPCEVLDTEPRKFTPIIPF